MKGGFLCPRRAVRQGGGHHHLVPTSRTTCIYLPFRFIHTTRTHRPPPLSPTRHALYVRSRFPLYFHVFVCGVSSPAARWPMFERERKRERERGRESSEKRAVTEEEGRRKGEREILKRHKGRPHALKGNNSFRDRDRFYSWSDVWEIRLPVGHATHPLFFPYSPPFPSLFLSFFLLSFSFWLLSLVRITRARFIHTTVGRRV